MTESIAQWGVFVGVVLWDLAVAIAVWRHGRNRISWREEVRPPKSIKKDRVTRDWSPLV